MDVTYLYHSGFLVETEGFYYVFDYFKGTLPKLKLTKPVYVFSSHFHADHYNPEIFKLLNIQGIKQIYGVLSWDISPKRIPDDTQIIRVKASNQYVLPGGQQVQTLHSTDEGVAFLVSDPEGMIYHAGDLNDWVWEEESKAKNLDMTKRFTMEIDKISNLSVALAFLPLDPRQGEDYARGMLYFLQHVKADKVYPMHYWDHPQIMMRFLEEYPQFSDTIQYTETVKS